MLFSHFKLLNIRFVLILSLLAGMFVVTPVRQAQAATYIVTNTNADGLGSLSNAILNAARFEGGTITFDPSLAGQTITFNSQLDLFTFAHVTIDGSGLNPPVIVSGGSTSGILKITGIAIFDISNIVFTQAVAEDGSVFEISGGSRLNIENCTFMQNQATGSGGAIAASGNSIINVTNGIFDQNHADGSGGAISSSGNVPVTIVGSTFSNNSADGDGGAIASPTITLIDSTLTRNTAGDDGGALYSLGPAVIQGTTIEENVSNSRGGAIFFSSFTNTITNSTVYQNRASEGGAIMASGNANIDIFNSTFANNHATDGTELKLFGINSLNLHNTIFVCVTGNENCYTTSFARDISTDHSILGIGLLVDYGLAEPADNGGPTQTMALLPDSPLIDAGNDSVCANSEVSNLDQRGVARTQDSHCDIGAYEDQSLIRYVKQDATGTGDGSSWVNAHIDLQAALAAASPDEEIWVAAGTYKPIPTTDRTISFNLKNGVSIFGGFVGTETDRSQRDYENNLTVLSGDIGVEEDDSDNSYHVVVANNVNTSAWLDGFTITGGNANDGSINTGGGMDVHGGSPSLAHVIFQNNYATFGGGMHATGDSIPPTISPILTDVTFRGNSAVEGGGMRNFEFSSPILTDVIFDSNSVIRTGGGMENFSYSNPALTNVLFLNNTAGELGAGGGMYNWVGNIPILMNVVFTGNTARWGGGMGNHQSSPILRNVVFTNNSASWYGGGMSNENNSNPRLTDVSFDSNTALSDIEETAAGGMHNRSSSPSLTNVTFSDNSANYIGGGMVNELGSSPELMNVTFTKNSADYGGAMLNRDANSNPTLTYVTMSNNIATISGGAIGNSGTPIIINSILWGNSGGEIFNILGTPTISHSIVQGGHPGTANLDEDPLLGPLQDNGGFTQTMALGTGSPAVNAADDTYCPSTDQRGVTRPQGSHCDLGAYEYDRSTVEVVIGNTHMDSYLLYPQESQRKSYTDMNSGPVRVNNLDNTSILAAERVIYKVKGVQTSFSEIMGLPENQLDKTYWFPWYNNVGLDTQLRIANVTNNPAAVQVTIDGMAMTPLNLAAGESTRVSYPGMNSGPVKIESDQDIVVAERAIYKVNSVHTSFSEMMALPNSQLDTVYWLPWYNNVDLDTQLRIANVTDQQATITVTIGGIQQTPFNLAAGESTRVSYPGVNNGPVKIESTQNIVAAERVIYKVKGIQTSFSEMMALPDSQLDTVYWLPWYNNVDLDTQLRFGNVSDQTATVRVYIGGQEMVGSPFTLQLGESTRQSFPNISNGPMKITSNVPIVVAERVIYKVKGIETSFSEMMALPNALLDAIFWFPWYNNVDLDTQLRFGVP